MAVVAAGKAVRVEDMSFDLIAILAAVGGVIATVAAAWIKGRRAGRDALIVEQAKNDDRTRKEFDRIDRQSPDVDVSVGRLRQRASKARGPDAK